jgi:cytochrome oxidase Cu insertion factor (SCO1/SenC/PrrC family)
VVAIGAAALVGVLTGIVVHLATLSSSPAVFGLPLYHGEGLWGPGQRRAPAFTLRDQDGRPVSLASQRGQPVLIAFSSASRRGAARAEGIALAQTESVLGNGPKPTLDVISLDPDGDTPARISAATASWGLSRPYHWLTGPPATLEAVRRAYGVTAPAGAAGPLFLVDRHGFERAGYLYPFVPNVLARDLRTLER